MDSLWDLGIEVIRLLQGLGDCLTAPMKAFTSLGQIEFYMLFIPALYWCWDSSLGLRVVLMLTLSVGLNEALKIGFHDPRPYWISQRIDALSSDPYFGLPSGHAQHSMGLWGLLAASLRRRWASAVAIALIFLIGLSRMYLGVHFPTDVLCGWLIGAILLWAFLRWEATVKRWLDEASFRQRVAISFLASLALLALTVLSLISVRGWQLPEAWARTALASSGEPIDPVSPANALNIAGMLFGLGTGAAWTSRMGGFSAGGRVWKRAVRYLLGLLGVIALYYGLRTLFPHDPGPVRYGLYYVRATLVAGWVSGGAPALFLRLGLAEKREPGV
jgi:membrane-associated phospholipid phosphatase